ncbi:hypothetical protein BV898_14922 [Hypsibius exemplaris]|uniref:Uncharacterized protein n=1 Tax=Hypsibius exemplaris TaxID=2072580 RepID=A0A9X6RJY3_HYPEX|nr:hypothetical protein BV898_14922 [Hypsibius exemplaris]
MDSGSSPYCKGRLRSRMQTAVLALFLTGFPTLSNAFYKYDFYNVNLEHLSSKGFHLTIPCQALASDSLRSGHLTFNSPCGERQQFSVEITAPSTERCGTLNSSSSQEPQLYLNLRSHSLVGKELIELSDPLVPGKKRLTSFTLDHSIEQVPRSFGQLLTSGSSALIEFLPSADPSSRPSCSGDLKLLDVEFVLVSSAVPVNAEPFKFMMCSAVGGLVPTGMMCNQVEEHVLGCPVSLSSDANNLDPAGGQDRRNVNCYPLAFHTISELKIVEKIVDGIAVAVTPHHHSAVASSSNDPSSARTSIRFPTLLFSFLLYIF